MPRITDPFDSTSLLPTFPDSTLRDLARNDCADHKHRKLATEILLNRKSPLAHHEDLRMFVLELKAELDGIEFAVPDEVVEVEPGPGPLRASVTTATMFGSEDVIDNGSQIPQEAPESVQIMDEPARKPTPRVRGKAVKTEHVEVGPNPKPSPEKVPDAPE